MNKNFSEAKNCPQMYTIYCRVYIVQLYCEYGHFLNVTVYILTLKAVTYFPTQLNTSKLYILVTEGENSKIKALNR
jgi:hypothetical protein